MFSRCQCVFREVNSLWSVILFYFLDEISTNWLDGELYNIESQDARQLSTPAKPITSGGKRRSFEKWKRVKITLSKIPFCLPCFKLSMCLYHYKRIGKGIVMCANLCVFFSDVSEEVDSEELELDVDDPVRTSMRVSRVFSNRRRRRKY